MVARGLIISPGHYFISRKDDALGWKAVGLLSFMASVTDWRANTLRV